VKIKIKNAIANKLYMASVAKKSHTIIYRERWQQEKKMKK